MPQWTAQADMTFANLPNVGGAGDQVYRVSNAINTYTQGIAVGLTAIDSQVLPDFQTVQPLAAGTTTPNFVGIVRAGWAGFDNAGALNASYTSAASYTNVQGSAYVRVTVKGIEYLWVDQSGTGAVTITNGIQIVSSRNTAGYGQGVAIATATPRSGLIGSANLPASGLGSSLTAASLQQAIQTYTITGTPASGDIITATFQIPYTDAQPGTAQTTTVSVTLNSSTAASVTTAAAALAAAMNANPYFATQTIHGVGNPTPYYVATSAAGVVSVTINSLANPFLVTGGTTNLAGNALEQYRYFTFVSGMVANTLTTTGTYTQAGASSGVLTVGGANFGTGGTQAGTGYKGKVPVIVYGAY